MYIVVGAGAGDGEVEAAQCSCSTLFGIVGKLAGGIDLQLVAALGVFGDLLAEQLGRLLARRRAGRCS